MTEQPLEWKTEQRKVDDLVPFAYNPRVLTDKKRDQLQRSLEKFNLVEIPAINLDNMIIAGHQRITVLKLLGRGEEMIDIRVPNRMLTEKELKEYNITSNVQVGLWDVEVLNDIFDDIDLKGLGLNVHDLPSSLKYVEIPDLSPDEDLPDVNSIQTDIVPGDLFELTGKGLRHRLICGDSTLSDVVQKLLGTVIPILMVTDPPYGVNYDPTWRDKINAVHGKRNGAVTNDDIPSWIGAYSLFTGDVMYIWHASRFQDIIMKDISDCGFELRSQIIWVKSTFVLSRGDYHWQHEPCLYAVRKGKNSNWYGGRDQSTVWEIRGLNVFNSNEDTMTSHGTQKPIEAMAKPIINNTRKGESIYDPFGGSGTSMVASHQLGRNCYMGEIDPRYCQMIIDRMKKFDPELKVERISDEQH
jgi:DNA modification methylase